MLNRIYPSKLISLILFLCAGQIWGSEHLEHGEPRVGPRYVVSIEGSDILLNGEVIKILGFRTSNALISDETTDDLIAHLDVYKAHGLNTVSVYFMGSRFGDVKGYLPDASLNPIYSVRMGKIIEAADARGMIVLVGCLYWGTSEAKSDLGHWDQSDSNEAIANTVRWLSENDYRNVIVDPDNEGTSPWNVGPMCDAAHAVDDSIMIANNSRKTFSQCDLNIHWGEPEAGKPWFDSEDTPGGPNTYWAGYSKHSFNNDSSFRNYSRIGRYRDWMKQSQFDETRAGMENWNGYIMASTWLQCSPNEGVGGPFAKLGGRAELSSKAVDTDIDELHPDAGVRWWAEFVRDEYGGAWVPPAPLLMPPEVSFISPANETFLFAPANLGVEVDAFDVDGSVISVDLFIDGSPVRTESGAPYEWGTAKAGVDDPLLLGLEKGVYTLTAVATDDGGATNSATVTVTVLNEGDNLLPTANIIADVTTGYSPLVVNFDASASADRDGNVVDYSWDFGDGQTGSGQMVQHTFVSPGSDTFGVQLTVTDNDGATDTEQITINIESALPQVSFETPSDGDVLPVGTDLYVLVNAVDEDGIGHVNLYLDGDFIRKENSAAYEWGNSSTKDSELRNMAAGTYELRAEATDANGDKGVATISITISDEPIIEFPDVYGEIENGDMIITWDRTGNENCVLQTTTDLSAGDWIDVMTNPVGVGETTLSVTIPVDESKAFFRLKCD